MKELESGDKFKLYCHRDGCKNYLHAIMIHPSVGGVYIPSYNQSIDIRNEVWYCATHSNNPHRKLNHHRKSNPS